MWSEKKANNGYPRGNKDLTLRGKEKKQGKKMMAPKVYNKTRESPNGSKKKKTNILCGIPHSPQSLFSTPSPGSKGKIP